MATSAEVDPEGGPERSLDESKLREVVRSAKRQLQMNDLKEQHELELLDQRQRHLRELEKVRLQAQVQALTQALASFRPAIDAYAPQATPDVQPIQPIPAVPDVPDVPDAREEPAVLAVLAVPPVRAAPALQPSLPAVTRAPEPAPHIRRKLSEVLPIWQRLKAPKLATIEVYTAAVKRFEAKHPSLHVDAITRAHIREFIEWLQADGKKAKTIEKEHGALRALLAIAESEEWVITNVAKNAKLPSVEKSKMRSYTPDECKLIFSSPVFVSGARPTGCLGEAAYWMPLLLLFTGARREEVGQITAERVRLSEGAPYILLDTIAEDDSLKTDRAKRCVPIHATLLKIGFLDFVESVRAGGGSHLFPLLKTNARGQYSGKWGDWWGRYIRDVVGLKDKKLQPAHGFRHLFITECRRLKFRPDYEHALVGHAEDKKRNNVHDAYGEFLIPELSVEVNRIDFRGLDLSALYKNKTVPT